MNNHAGKDVSSESTDWKIRALVGAIRDVAKENGYAIGVHGSLRRDIDLIAVPWTSSAIHMFELARLVDSTIAQLFGFSLNKDKEGAETPEYFDQGCPGFKPHGRRTWSFHTLIDQFPTYVDLSVMPLAPRDEPVLIKPL